MATARGRRRGRRCSGNSRMAASSAGLMTASGGWLFGRMVALFLKAAGRTRPRPERFRPGPNAVRPHSGAGSQLRTTNGLAVDAPSPSVIFWSRSGWPSIRRVTRKMIWLARKFTWSEVAISNVPVGCVPWVKIP